MDKNNIANSNPIWATLAYSGKICQHSKPAIPGTFMIFDDLVSANVLSADFDYQALDNFYEKKIVGFKPISPF